MRREDAIKARSEVVGRVFQGVCEAARLGGPPIEEVINEILYLERERLRQRPSYGDSEADHRFYRRIRRKLPRSSEGTRKELLREILQRYTDEICGHFNPRVFSLATRSLPVMLTGLLNGLSPKRLLSHRKALPRVEEQLLIQGPIQQIRRLHERGIVVYTPTHSSNLDSIILGYGFHQAGLPPVAYGAGLNLFANPVLGFFMRNLGAYTVDRMKQGPIYKQCLKAYATVSMELGYDNLFFPGGTRSRSNVVERDLKRGLLGTTLSAFYNNLKLKKEKPRIYIVPTTINYPLVLEASTLIDDHLRRAGKARYIIMDDEFSRWQRQLDFMKGLFELDQRIRICFGAPLDPFGNSINEEGDSLDPKGRVIDPARYLMEDGELRVDAVRDAEYTTTLAERIAEAFQSETVVTANNVAAFALFELSLRQSGTQDLYRFLRELGPETDLPIHEVEEEIEALSGELKALERVGKVQLDPVVQAGTPGEILSAALRSLGSYHHKAALHREGVRVRVEDANLLFFYRNRLDSYGLRDSPERGRRSR